MGGRVGNVDAVGNLFKSLSTQLAQSNKDLSEVGVDPGAIQNQSGLADSTKDLIEKNKQLQSEYDTTKGILEAYGNSQQRLIVLNEELKRAQTKRKTLKELAVQATIGTSEEKESAQRLINAITIARQEGIDAVAPELQRQVLPYLENIDGNTNVVDEKLRSVGLDEGIITPSDKEKEIAGEMLAIEEAGLKAAQYMGQETAMRIREMATVIEELHSKFISELTTLMIDAQKRSAESDLALAESEEGKLDAEKQNWEAIAATLGVDKDFFQDKTKKPGSAVTEGEKRRKWFMDQEGGEGGVKRKMQLLGADEDLTDEERQARETSARVLAQDVDIKGQSQYLGPIIQDLTGLTNSTDLFNKALDERNSAWLAYLGGSVDSSLAATEGADEFNTIIEGLKKQFVSSGLGDEGMFDAIVDRASKDPKATADTALMAILQDMKNAQKAATESQAEMAAEAQGLGIPIDNLAGVTDENLKTAATSEQSVEKTEADRVRVTGQIEQSNEEIAAATEAQTETDKQTKAREETIEDQRTDNAIKASEQAEGLGAGAARPPGVPVVGGALAVPTEVVATADNTAGMLVGINSLADAGTSKGSIFTHDVHAEVLLQGILNVLSGGGTGGFAGISGGMGIGGMSPEMMQAMTVAQQEGMQALAPEMQAALLKVMPQLAGGMSKEFQTLQAASPEIQQKIKEAEAALAEKRGKFKADYGSDQASFLDADYKKEGLMQAMADAKSGATTMLGGHGGLDESIKAIITGTMASLSGGGGEGGGAFNMTSMIDTSMMEDSITKFSKNIEDMGLVMGSALSVEVGGTVDVNVNLNGAEFLKSAEDAMGVFVGGKISDAINNFITNGLKNNNVKTGDWAADNTSQDQAIGSNSSGGGLGGGRHGDVAVNN